LHYEILFKNLSNQNLQNLFLVATLEGRVLDFNSVKVDNGKFQVGDNSIIWDAQDVPYLRFLGQGEEGKVDFWVNVKDSWQIFSPKDKNFVIKTKILLSDARQEFTLKVGGNLDFRQSFTFEDPNFENEGPFPPKVGQTTSFTINWKVKSFYTDIKNAKVKARLAPGVEMSEKILPQEANLTFDSSSRELLWNIGDLQAYTGLFSPPKEVSFQIKFTPTQNQESTLAPLISEVVISGEDDFTGRSISSEVQGIFLKDPVQGEEVKSE
jgi:hypothetical protein